MIPREAGGAHGEPYLPSGASRDVGAQEKLGEDPRLSEEAKRPKI